MIAMTRHDLLFAGTRLLGLYFFANLVLRLPAALEAIFDWRSVGWVLLNLAAYFAVGFMLAIRTQDTLDMVGADRPAAQAKVDPPASGDASTPSE